MSWDEDQEDPDVKFVDGKIICTCTHGFTRWDYCSSCLHAIADAARCEITALNDDIVELRDEKKKLKSKLRKSQATVRELKKELVCD